jgi:hypothetical protein
MRSTLLLYSLLVATLQVTLFVRCRAFTSSNGKRFSSRRNTTFLKKSISESSVQDTIATTSPILTTNKDELEKIKSLTEIAIYDCVTEKGLEALESLFELCSRRIPYDFGSRMSKTMQSHTVCANVTAGTPMLDQTVTVLPQLLPSSTTNSLLDSVRKLEQNGWLSTNPDSVDGLPSLHLNLISNGKPLFPVDTNAESSIDEGKLFEGVLCELYHIVQPYVYNTLLPAVNEMLDTSTIRVSDVFLRRYGQDVFEGISRNSISAHYDVFSRVTAVVALDNAAADGRNGLFTTVVDDTNGQTSNHKALRRFFPLRTGDCVVHTWDVLHGVDVEAGLDRSSLIVWFTEDENIGSNDNGTMQNDPISEIAPWLTKHPELQHVNDVLQFVLASAFSSVGKSDLSTTSLLELKTNEVELYLRSSSKGNIFALTRMGSICEEGTLSPVLQGRALSVLEELRPYNKLPLPIRDILSSHKAAGDDHLNQQLAIRFWLEGALGGNPLAQRALADEVMFEASQSGSASGRLLAAVLFALSAQQDDVASLESIEGVVQFDLSARNVDSQDAFLASPVVQVAKAALG